MAGEAIGDELSFIPCTLLPCEHNLPGHRYGDISRTHCLPGWQSILCGGPCRGSPCFSAISTSELKRVSRKPHLATRLPPPFTAARSATARRREGRARRRRAEREGEGEDGSIDSIFHLRGALQGKGEEEAEAGGGREQQAEAAAAADQLPPRPLLLAGALPQLQLRANFLRQTLQRPVWLPMI